MRIRTDEAIFIAIDYQEKLLPAILNAEKVVKNTEFLLDGLKLLDLPMIMTTQCERSLGPNIDSIRAKIGPENSYDKSTFSILKEESILSRLKETGRIFCILAGTEAHICVLQSLIDLKEAGFIPVLVTDCTGSRTAQSKEGAIRRAMQEGAILTTSEALLYELFVSADHPRFKELTRLVKNRT